MPDLIAQGNEPLHRWRRALPADEAILLGRDAGRWSVPWDERISRRHVSLSYSQGKLRLSVLPEALNPVFHRGRRVHEALLTAGEHFVIGGTTFTLAEERLAASLAAPPPQEERTFSPQELHARSYREPDSRLAALGRLPTLMAQSATEDDLLTGVVALALSGIPAAAGVAIANALDAAAPLAVRHWDYRQAGQTWEPSERLIRAALAQRTPLAHAWSAQQRPNADFTAAADLDWAFCVPVPGEVSRGWAIYVAGKFADRVRDSLETLTDDLKFAELLAATLGSLRDAQLAAQRQTLLSQILSPPVAAAFSGQSPERALAPREAEVSVLFCDLRGFARQSERWSGTLLELLSRVSQALGLMTRQILDHGGVIGDFHGDSAMGFWGWPVDQPDSQLRACRAALAIRREFLTLREQSEASWGGFQIGVGIASGRAVAGKLGTLDQVKVTAFGPVVNLASRLEGLTKTIHTPILLDGATAAAVRASADFTIGRVRRVAAVRPAGLEQPVDLHELLPAAEELPSLTDDQLRAYERAWDAARSGNWLAAKSQLAEVPAEDRVKEFLTRVIERQRSQPTTSWHGIIDITEK